MAILRRDYTKNLTLKKWETWRFPIKEAAIKRGETFPRLFASTSTSLFTFPINFCLPWDLAIRGKPKIESSSQDPRRLGSHWQSLFLLPLFCWIACRELPSTGAVSSLSGVIHNHRSWEDNGEAPCWVRRTVDRWRREDSHCFEFGCRQLPV